VDVKTNVQLIGALTDGGPLQNDALADESRPKRRSDLNYRTIDGKTVILNRKDGRLHSLTRPEVSSGIVATATRI
jgi:hypothetical protein